MFDDFSDDKSITFTLNPAVRNPTGACIEESNCDWEKVTLCTFNVTTDMKAKVTFLACMVRRHRMLAVASGFVLHVHMAHRRTTTVGYGRAIFCGCFVQRQDDSKSSKALTAAKACAEKASIDASSVPGCFAGSKGSALLEAASKVWNKAFPARATVPHIFVDQKNVEPQYRDIKSALCKAGSTSKTCSKFCEI